MTATCTITSATDPITATNDTAVIAAGTCTAANTVTVTIVDPAGATVGPVTATVAGTSWSIAATDVSALADGILVYEATASDGSASAFAARGAQKLLSAAIAYVSVPEFRDYIGSDTSNKQALVESVLLEASREVDFFCGRTFYQQTATFYFTPEPDNYFILDFDDNDLATTAGLSVHIDTGFAGTYTEERILNTDFICEPVNQSVNGIGGWPFTSLRSINGKIWFQQYAEYQRDTVKVTGTWGWPAVPDPVVHATKVLAAQRYKMAEAPLGYNALNGWGEVRLKEIPMIATMLQPYVKQSSKFLIA